MIGGLGGDPLNLLGRVFEQAIGRLASDDERNPTGNAAPDELIVTALGDRLGRMISGDSDGHHDGDWPDINAPRCADDDWLAHYQELLEHNSVVAAALGACDCWGRNPGCPICDGLGIPGWELPQEQLFAAYVHPAIDAATPIPSTPPSHEERDTVNERQEHSHGHLA